MNGFSAVALARPLDAAQGVWEFSHDFVVLALLHGIWDGGYLDWPGIARAYAAPALFVFDGRNRAPARLLGMPTLQIARDRKSG